MASLYDSVQRLLGRFEGVHHARRRRAGEPLGDDFNIIQVLARHGSADERYIHTPLLADLLNPSANHELGDVFISEFFKKVPTEATQLTEQSLRDAVVKVEDKNVDIRLFLDEMEVIIENKLNATDQDRQIERYVENRRSGVDNLCVIYLTLEGGSPSARSLGSLRTDEAPRIKGEAAPFFKVTDGSSNNPVPVVLLSYNDDVRRALEATVREARCNGRYESAVVSGLEQYREIVKKVVGGKRMTEISDEATLLSEGPENLALGVRLRDAATEAYDQRVANFLDVVDRRLSLVGEEVDGSYGLETRRLGSSCFESETKKIVDQKAGSDWSDIMAPSRIVWVTLTGFMQRPS